MHVVRVKIFLSDWALHDVRLRYCKLLSKACAVMEAF